MNVTSVLAARAVAWIEPAELNKDGRVYYPTLTQALVHRYGFQKWPKTAEEFDEGKGITFAMGHLGDAVIDQLTIYKYGLVLETSVSTDFSRQLLEEALEWGREELHLTYDPPMIKRWQYASQLLFHSEAKMTLIGPAVEKLAKRIADGVNLLTGDELDYEVLVLSLDYDQLRRKHPLGGFSIQRRDNTPFSENKYFSDAPLPTQLHIELLTEFERDLLAKAR